MTNAVPGVNLWNGPICPTCGPYLGTHACQMRPCPGCATKDAVIANLMKLLGGASAPLASPPSGQMACPCRPENGGSGICGCILYGPKITC